MVIGTVFGVVRSQFLMLNRHVTSVVHVLLKSKLGSSMIFHPTQYINIYPPETITSGQGCKTSVLAKLKIGLNCR